MFVNVNSNYEIVVRILIYVFKLSVDDFVIKFYFSMVKRFILKDNNVYFNLRNNFIRILGYKYDLIV